MPDIERRKNNTCDCGKDMWYKDGNLKICSWCGNQFPMKRETDKELPTLAQLKELWQ